MAISKSLFKFFTLLQINHDTVTLDLHYEIDLIAVSQIWGKKSSAHRNEAQGYLYFDI